MAFDNRYMTTLGYMPHSHRDLPGKQELDAVGATRTVRASTRLAEQRTVNKGTVMEQNYKACHGMPMLASKSVDLKSKPPVSKWHEYINDPYMADAILDN